MKKYQFPATRLLAVLVVSGWATAQTAAPVLRQSASLSPGAAIVAGSPSDTRDLMPEVPGMPKGSISLVGGTIRTLDRVRDQITLQVVGGGKAVVLFDPRTHVYRNGVAATLHDLQTGQRINIDTMLDGKDVFARNIRIVTATSMGQSSGQIVAHEPGSADLTVRDALSPEPLKLSLDSTSVVKRDGRQVSAEELVPGALVSTDFRPDGQGRIVVRQIAILAIPGSTFFFVGQVAHLDLSRGLLVVVDPRDQRNYDIHCDPSLLRAHPELHEGVQVSVRTTFDGTQYAASGIDLLPAGK
ncbi:MAG: hypothetical protein JOZ14_07485 [Acidobacteria bacterium]|nr:hypothetical protein [Acidobacteriota bacterium]